MSPESPEKSFAVLDQAAWEELVARFDGRMWAVARAFGLSPADAADAVQGAWLRMVESLDGIRDPERIGAWLITTTRHEAVRLSRRARGEVMADHELPDVAGPDPAAAIVDADFGRHVWQRLHTLGEPCRSLLRLYVLNPDAKYAQIAIRLNLPVGSIGPTRARCLSRLRTLVQDDDA
ncbi:sigma-70 family RNA polymerase sigma factor [Planotetraspora sp. A-T 1434]|uniref:RNA polymerase sigma factor n=1 Tax=Planotetraspora sp. A-T 1434 TaxID=2979219 RepID=UPI0021BE6901|nr:sigma-70 family RNA polymerase sigma factor [Planotetraspora sp. A-T 1434]MCT9931145.1 sigma-70 family RNA polymerase sigma factor [Planotetraspora sp. A-T 1434]